MLYHIYVCCYTFPVKWYVCLYVNYSNNYYTDQLEFYVRLFIENVMYWYVLSVIIKKRVDSSLGAGLNTLLLYGDQINSCLY